MNIFIYSTFLITLLGCTPLNSNITRFGHSQKNEKLPPGNWNDYKYCQENLQYYMPDQKVWEYIKLNFYRNNKDHKTYFLTCADDIGPSFHELLPEIDFATVQDLGEYLVDKDYVYYYYDISDGRMIYKLEDADRSTFQSFGNSMYARDKDHVYYSRKGIMDSADVETFEIIDLKNSEARIPLARDKNHLYTWNEILQDTFEIEGLKEFLKGKK